MSSFEKVALSIAIPAAFWWLAVGLEKKSQAGKDALPLPPGPKGLPVLGNALDMPQSKQGQTFWKWKETYGNLVHLNVLGTHIIIINSHAIATELLEKRFQQYSDRPYLAMAGDLVGWDRGLPLGKFGLRHREMRRQAHAVIGGKNGEVFFEMEEHESIRYLSKLLKRPDDFLEHIKWIIGNYILKITYGYSVEETNDPWIKTMNEVMTEFSKSAEPGVWLVDVFPALRQIPTWFPGAVFKKTAEAMRRSGSRIIAPPYEATKADTSRPQNFVSQTLEHYGPSVTPEQEDITMWTALAMFGGGSDTSVSAISACFLAFLHYPNVQQKAQSEIDTLVGSDRLPNFSDRPNLPYVNALIKEVLRWGVVAPTGLPHVLTEDDVYEGMKIPKGSIVLPNIWGMCHDPDVYSNPDTFDPERFLKSPPDPDPRNVAFGFGRRVCPGNTLAEQSIYIIVVRTLAAFTLSPIDPANLPALEWIDGVVSHPKEYNAKFTPRSEAITKIIEAGSL